MDRTTCFLFQEPATFIPMMVERSRGIKLIFATVIRCSTIIKCIIPFLQLFVTLFKDFIYYKEETLGFLNILVRSWLQEINKLDLNIFPIQRTPLYIDGVYVSIITLIIIYNNIMIQNTWIF